MNACSFVKNIQSPYVSKVPSQQSWFFCRNHNVVIISSFQLKLGIHGSLVLPKLNWEEFSLPISSHTWHLLALSVLTSHDIIVNHCEPFCSIIMFPVLKYVPQLILYLHIRNVKKCYFCKNTFSIISFHFYFCHFISLMIDLWE
jgi:hypothetical protein